MSIEELRQHIMQVAAGHRGFAANSVPGVRTNAVDYHCRVLMGLGLLYQAKFSHRAAVWFTSANAAQSAMDMSRAGKAGIKERTSASKANTRLRDNTPVEVPEGIVVQVGPAFVPRYQGNVSVSSFGLQRGRVAS